MKKLSFIKEMSTVFLLPSPPWFLYFFSCVNITILKIAVWCSSFSCLLFCSDLPITCNRELQPDLHDWKAVLVHLGTFLRQEDAVIWLQYVYRLTSFYGVKDSCDVCSSSLGLWPCFMYLPIFLYSHWGQAFEYYFKGILGIEWWKYFFLISNQFLISYTVHAWHQSNWEGDRGRNIWCWTRRNGSIKSYSLFT